MFRDYYDESDTWGLHNPYAPVPLFPEGRSRQSGMLLGLVGVGLAAVLPITGRGSVPAPAPDAGPAVAGSAVDVPPQPEEDDAEPIL